MTSTTHQLIALTSALWTLTIYPVSLGPYLGILSIIAVMIGALTPDLDQPTANIWRRLIGGNIVGNIFQSFSGGHRHLTHSFLGIGLVGWALNWAAHNLVSPNFTGGAIALWAAFMVGYISHPIADSFTDKGVPWFYPFYWQIKFPPGPEEVRVTTNSFVERVIIRGAVITVAALLVKSHWPTLQAFFANH